MNLDRLNILGCSVLGIFASVSDKYCVLTDVAKEGVVNSINKTLQVTVIKRSIMNSNFIGLFMAGNSDSVIVSQLAGKLKLDIPVKVLKSNYTCIGNLILCNDNGALVSPILEEHVPQISRQLKVKAKVGTIAGLPIVGSCGLATNKGCLVHPDIKKDEAHLIEDLLEVKVDRGTLNHGSPYVGACAIANSNGALVGTLTTSPELLRLEQTLG